MNTFIERHPLVFFGVAMVITVLLATAYLALSEEVESRLPWFAGVPYSTVACASPSSSNHLPTCYFSVVESDIGTTLASV